MALSSTTPPWPAFRAFAHCFIPETARATEAQWEELERVVRDALAARPPGIRRQIGLFVRVVDLSAMARHRHRFDTLGPGQATSLLESFAVSRVLPFRRGIWGLRTLVMMGWYTNPTVIAALGYRATPAGWDARR